MHIDDLTLNLLGFAATGFSIFMWVPQARITWQSRNDATRLAGISETTQWLSMIGYLLWGFFGVLSGSFWVAAPSVVSFPLAIATIFVMRRGRRLPPVTTSVSIIAMDEPLSVADTTGSIAIISTGDSVAVGDAVSTGTISIISTEESVAVGETSMPHAFTPTAAIPVLA